MVGLSIPSLAKSLVNAVKNGNGDSEKEALHQKAKKTAEDFEAVFLTQILNSMTEGLDSDSSAQEEGLSAGDSKRQWETYKNEFLARNIAQSGGIGLSGPIMQEILRAQGA